MFIELLLRTLLPSSDPQFLLPPPLGLWWRFADLPGQRPASFIRPRRLTCHEQVNPTVVHITLAEPEHRNGCRHDQISVTATITAIQLSTSSKALMNSLSDNKGVTFCAGNMFTRT